MKETVLEKVPRILREKLDITKKYVAAVSGGADSLALADALQHCGFRFTVCHVEHGIRAEESLEDAAYVEKFCRQRGIVFCCKHVDAQELQKREKLSLEDAARRLRYRALFQCVEETGFSVWRKQGLISFLQRIRRTIRQKLFCCGCCAVQAPGV